MPPCRLVRAVSLTLLLVVAACGASAQTALAALDARVNAAMDQAMGDPDAVLTQAEVDALRAEVQDSLSATLDLPDGSLDAVLDAWLTDNAFLFSLLGGDYSMSTPGYAQESVDAWEAVLGPDHLYLAAKLDALGLVLAESGTLDGAEEALRRALSIQVAHLAPHALGPTLTRQALGSLLVRRGQYDEADALLVEALAALDTASCSSSVPYAEALIGRAHVQIVRGDVASAAHTLDRALAILDTPEPSAVHALTVSLRHFNAYLVAAPAATARAHDVAAWHDALTQGAQAARARLTAWRDALTDSPPPEGDLLTLPHPAITRTLHHLARLLARAGRPDSARVALELWGLTHTDALRGIDDPGEPSLPAAQANWTAALRLAAGDANLYVTDVSGEALDVASPRAEARFRLTQALETFEAELGSDHPTVAEVRTDLAAFLESQGDPQAARRHHERALSTRESVFGPEHPVLVDNLLGLARTRALSGDLEAAREAAERVASSTAGGEEVRAADALRVIARAALDAGDLDLAGRLSRGVMDARLAALGPEHPAVAEALADLGDIRVAAGNAAEAVAQYRDALSRADAALDSTDVALARFTRGLARALMAPPTSHDARAEAIALLLRTARIYDYWVRSRMGELALSEQLALTQRDLASVTDALLTASLSEEDLRAAYQLIGGWKGLFHESVRRQTRAIQALDWANRDDDDRTARRAEAYARVRRQIVAALHGSSKPDLAHLDSLSREKESLERVLFSYEAGAFGVTEDPWTENGLMLLQSNVDTENEAFVDLYRTSPQSPDSARYLAVVLNPPLDYGSDYLEEARLPGDSLFSDYREAAELAVVDLGLASEIAVSVQDWREAVLAGQLAEAETQRLTDQLWSPLAEVIQPTARAVTISPDGELARVPWAMMAAAHGGASRFLVAQRTSARERIRMSPLDPEAAILLVVGGVDFGSGAAWSPLPGTLQEAETIAALASDEGHQVTLLTGSQPTLSVLLDALPQASHVHLATHGFVSTVPQASVPPAVRSRDLEFESVQAEPGPLPRNPLAESGLAIADANQNLAGILTAEDLLGLDLSGGLDGSGTRLVVLSACDTGRGAEVTGQGVLGLQSSFAAAGAGAVLMSLWPVPDESTATLMTAFYGALWGEVPASPAEALALAQAEVRSRPGWDAPLYWAAWVLSGDAYPSRW